MAGQRWGQCAMRHCFTHGVRVLWGGRLLLGYKALLSLHTHEVIRCIVCPSEQPLELTSHVFPATSSSPMAELVGAATGRGEVRGQRRQPQLVAAPVVCSISFPQRGTITPSAEILRGLHIKQEHKALVNGLVGQEALPMELAYQIYFIHSAQLELVIYGCILDSGRGQLQKTTRCCYKH